MLLRRIPAISLPFRSSLSPSSYSTLYNSLASLSASASKSVITPLCHPCPGKCFSTLRSVSCCPLLSHGAVVWFVCGLIGFALRSDYGTKSFLCSICCPSPCPLFPLSVLVPHLPTLHWNYIVRRFHRLDMHSAFFLPSCALLSCCDPLLL